MVSAATVTRIYGAMIYDQLFAFDENMIAHPQMVGDMKVSPDGLTYDFALRDGLAFHNGQKVTSADIVASIPRAAKQDPMMQLMVKRLAKMEAVDPTHFRLVFSKPYALVAPSLAGADGRNAVFYGERAIDRSPCGTGTSARLAHLFAKGRLKVGEAFVHESYIKSRFTGRVEAETKLGGRQAIIPSVEGSAIATGFNTIWVDRADPFATGFQVV